MTKKYKRLFLELKIKPSYLRKLKKIEKECTIKIGALEDFKRAYLPHPKK